VRKALQLVKKLAILHEKCMDTEIISKAWHTKGPFTIATPGLLILENGNVSFVTEEGEQFKVPVSGIKEVKWPFMLFGLGFKAIINGRKYTLTFMKGASDPELDDSTLDGLSRLTTIGRGAESIATLANWGKSKESAKQWKAVLGG
jgi:hypothetical protein